VTTASLTKLNLEELCSCTERLKNAEEKLKKCQSLAQIVWAAWYMGMEIARIIVEQELTIRAQSPTQWSSCPKCGSLTKVMNTLRNVYAYFHAHEQHIN